MNISFPCTITDIFERKIRKHLGGAGPEARFGTGSEGWYIQIDGMVSIYVGNTKPTFEIDEAIVLTIRKAGHA
jgi:hypothetical protein